jgi:cation diffusion facilitator family transporter
MSDPASAAPDLARTEQRTLWFGAWAGLALGGLGFVFAILSGSDAILLDGIFSLVGFGVALATIRVSQVIRQPATDKYQFGFNGLEALITVVKGGLMGIVGLFAAGSAIGSIVSGGSEVSAGAAATYSVLAATGCLVTAWVINRAAKETGSPILDVDVRAWLIDAGLSTAVGVAFLLTFVIQNTSLAWLVPYVDPGLVVLLTLVILPVPVRVLRVGMHQLLGGAPEPELQARIDAVLAREFETLEGVVPRVRMLQAGRVVYVQVYLVVPANVEVGGVALLDEVRGEIFKALRSDFPTLSLDVVFTGDGVWLSRSIGGTGEQLVGVAQA